MATNRDWGHHDLTPTDWIRGKPLASSKPLIEKDYHSLDAQQLVLHEGQFAFPMATVGGGEFDAIYQVDWHLLGSPRTSMTGLQGSEFSTILLLKEGNFVTEIRGVT
ncbi:hypothetical protein HJFPF1_11346 [Paramyrothecium foliicola]|nr:hypothetical protein HJFPF1_11346 [Paramyrothecium foliicola]